MTPDLRDTLIENANTDSVADVRARHCTLMAGFGFTRVLYGSTRSRTERSLGDPNDFVVLTNHDHAYRKGFVEDGLYRDAPMVR